MSPGRRNCALPIGMLAVCALLALPGCSADKRTTYRKSLCGVNLPELGVTLMLPCTWRITYANKSFYQLEATGLAPNGYMATLQLRSLPNSLQGTGSRALFANGWYQSVRDNNPGWKFLSRNQEQGDREGTFKFDGSFTGRGPEGDTFEARRVGRLRFRGNRVHAIYYTTANKGMGDTLIFFDVIDNAHKFYTPRKAAGALLLR